jgi:hypothetical protein
MREEAEVGRQVESSDRKKSKKKVCRTKMQTSDAQGGSAKAYIGDRQWGQM